MSDWIIFPVMACTVIGVVIMGIGLCSWSDDDVKRDRLRTLRDVGAGFAAASAIIEIVLFVFS